MANETIDNKGLSISDLTTMLGEDDVEKVDDNEKVLIDGMEDDLKDLDDKDDKKDKKDDKKDHNGAYNR